MNKGSTLIFLLIKDSVIDFFRMLFGLHKATYAIVGFFLFLSFMVAFNTPKGEASYLNGKVREIRTSSSTIQSGAGGFIAASAKVVIGNGIDIRITIDRPPLPKVGDTIRIAKFERAFSGTKYVYAGNIDYEN